MAIIAKPHRPEKPVIEQPEIVVTPEPQKEPVMEPEPEENENEYKEEDE
jgi:hypothetical protein